MIKCCNLNLLNDTTTWPAEDVQFVNCLSLIKTKPCSEKDGLRFALETYLGTEVPLAIHKPWAYLPMNAEIIKQCFNNTDLRKYY